MEEAVRHLCPHKAVGHTHLCTEHFKQWQREAYHGDKPKTLSQRESWLFKVFCAEVGVPDRLVWA